MFGVWRANENPEIRKEGGAKEVSITYSVLGSILPPSLINPLVLSELWSEERKLTPVHTDLEEDCNQSLLRFSFRSLYYYYIVMIFPTERTLPSYELAHSQKKEKSLPSSEVPGWWRLMDLNIDWSNTWLRPGKSKLQPLHSWKI